MALLQSIKIPLGAKMPAFKLPDPFGKIHDSEKLYGSKGLLVLITCNHCPYAIAVWPRTVRLAAYAKKLGIESVAINPNINPDYPEDAPEKMKVKIQEWGIDFPYLVDESQGTARKYQAQCTPDIYLMNAKHELVYHGRVDDNWKEESGVTKEELKTAMENLAFDKPIDPAQHPSMGCSIKWRE